MTINDTKKPEDSPDIEELADDALDAASGGGLFEGCYKVVDKADTVQNVKSTSSTPDIDKSKLVSGDGSV